MKFNPEDLLQIYLEGSFTEEAQAEFDRLMRQDPLFAERVTKALAERLGPVADPAVEAIAAKLDGKIGGLWEKNKPSPIARSLRLGGKMTLGLAALAGLYFGIQYGMNQFTLSTGVKGPGAASQGGRPATPLKKNRSVSFSITAKGIKPASTGSIEALKRPPVPVPTPAQNPSPPSTAAGPSSVQEGTSVQVAIDNEKTQTVSVVVFNAHGLLVRRLFQGVMDEGENSIPWDGKDDFGHPVLPGDYTLAVQAGGKAMSQTVEVQPEH